jgi:threonine synthase
METQDHQADLICRDCGAGMELKKADGMPARCRCGGVWEIVRNVGKLDGEKLRREFDKRLAERGTIAASGVWRFRELIAPELPEETLVTRGEGNTGLYLVAAAAAYAGVREVRMKAQSENPSGSFKDNGMAVAVSHGLSLGRREFACSSTGNTSSSLAMYAAWCGASARIFVPARNVAAAKLLQTAAYGGKLIRFDGTYDDGIRFLERYAGELGLYVCNSINPYRIEGQKSIVFEIAQQLGWCMPEWIVVPGGALSNVSALGMGLEELLACGLIKRLPRIALVQAEGASPFHRMVEKGETRLSPEPKPYTRASALNIGNPPSWRKALRALRVTNGVTVAVSDNEIMAAKRIIDRSGLGCEPASAATLAGLRKLAQARIVDQDETAVCVLTGHMLKDAEALEELYGVSEPGAADQSKPLTVERVRSVIYER